MGILNVFSLKQIHRGLWFLIITIYVAQLSKKTFYIDKSEDIVCLKLFNITSTENHTNFTKAWNFLKDQERISLIDVQDEVDMKLTKALRLQTFIESFLFQNSNFTK